MCSKRRKVVQQGQEQSHCESEHKGPTYASTPFFNLENFDANILLIIDEYMPKKEKLQKTHIHWFVAYGLSKKYKKAARYAVHYSSFQEVKTYMNIEEMQIPILESLQNQREVFERLPIQGQHRFAECLPLVTNRQLLKKFILDSRYDLDDVAYRFILNNVVLRNFEERKLIEFNIESGRPDRIPIYLYQSLPKPCDKHAFDDFMRKMHRYTHRRRTMRRDKVIKATIRITRLHDPVEGVDYS